MKTDDQKLVDSVFYLSSLASESKEIDPMLDTLRDVTSDWDGVSALSDEKRGALEGLIAELKAYLISRDPIRSFTPEILDQRLVSALAGDQKKVISFVTLLEGCIAAMIIAFIIPLHLSTLNHTYLALTTFLVALISTTIWLYFSSLRSFRTDFRQVFAYLSVSVILLGITMLHYALIGILQLTAKPLFRYGGATEVAMLSLGVLYLGIKKYAMTLSIPTRRTTIQVLLGILLSLVGTIAVAFLRHFPDKAYFGLSLAAISITVVFAYAAQGLISQLIHNVTAAYSKSLHIVYFFLWGVIGTASLFIVALSILGKLSVGQLSLLIVVAGIPTIVLSMYAGYSFKKETSR